MLKKLKRSIKCLAHGISPFKNWQEILMRRKVSEKTLRAFINELPWNYICSTQALSENFIREFKDIIPFKDVCITQKISESFLREFIDRLHWRSVSVFQKLSEDFIREFKDKINWSGLSYYQQLSEEFIKEFKDRIYWDKLLSTHMFSEDFLIWYVLECKADEEKAPIKESQHIISTETVNWYRILTYQKVSYEFIRRFKSYFTKNEWTHISGYQALSEDFMREFKTEINWKTVSKCQQMSEDFIREFCDKVDWSLIPYNQNISLDFCEEFNLDNTIPKLHKSIDSKKDAIAFAKKYKLKYDDKYLYAFRSHNKWGRGSYSKTNSYEKGKYYRDWRCNPIKDCHCSYGYGIALRGNTPIRVKLEDFCVEIEDSKEARVWGFEII